MVQVEEVNYVSQNCQREGNVVVNVAYEEAAYGDNGEVMQRQNRGDDAIMILNMLIVLCKQLQRFTIGQYGYVCWGPLQIGVFFMIAQDLVQYEDPAREVCYLCATIV